MNRHLVADADAVQGKDTFGWAAREASHVSVSFDIHLSSTSGARRARRARRAKREEEWEERVC
jgi:hypothetical protein